MRPRVARTMFAHVFARAAVAAGAASSAGCAPPRMVTPADVAQVSDEIVITDRSRAGGLFVSEAFTMGPYKIVRVHRGAVSTSSSGWKVGDIGSEKINQKAFYDFDLQASNGLYKGQCGMRSHDKETSFGHVIFAEPGSAGLDCNCSGGSPGVAHLVMDLRQRQGYLAPRSGAPAAVDPVLVSEKGGGGFMGAPLGYQVHGNLPLGAVDVMDRGRVWLNRSLEAGDRADLACLFVGLLLYRPMEAPPP